MTCVTNWKVLINQITLLFNFFLLKKITPPLSILSASSSIFYKFYNIPSFRSAIPQNWMAHKGRSGTNTSFSFSVKFRTIKGTFFHFFAGPSLCVEDRACPVISSKYLSKPSTHHRDAFFPEHIKLRYNVLNTRVFFQGISYLLVFWFCFSCLSKSENLILVDCGESNWPVAGFVSDSGYYSPGTNTPAATHCGKRFMPPKKSKKYILELQIIETWLKPNWK